MLRATHVIPAGDWDGAPADTVTLDYDQRHRRRMAMTGVGGLGFLLDLAEAVPLRDGAGLRLEDGRIVAIVAAPEPLAEITADSAPELMRIAWHLGNRHLLAQLEATRIRIRRDHVIEHMVEHLGGSIAHVEAAFDPEGGAYGGGHAHADGHGHDHHHDHEHPNLALGHDDRDEDEDGERA